jgi:quercetin dioxygenase-like cupin family protein
MKPFRVMTALGFMAIHSVAALTYAQAPPTPAPSAVLSVTTSALPKTDTHEVRIYAATLAPGAASAWHTHPSPPFVYVIEGALVLESEGRPPMEVKAGQAIAEPTGEVIRAVNRGTVPTKVVIFYVGAPRMPFLEEIRR